MSRMELKKQRKKSTRMVKLLFLLIFLLLLGGLMATDYTMREMLAIYDGKLLGYERMEDLHGIYLMGNIYYIDGALVREKVSLWTSEIREWIDKGYRWIKDKLPINMGSLSFCIFEG
ncbi:hypothetical protein F8153_06410 [Alkaliphilus serpentinus]|uniref:Uncharacterized protein n=2 Tax=Alkaliphilus serpentinus TaxID=1482731 RepID=A0A833HPI0_9FIRM|nr:hypothetical protein F8153_06410 [Alkaliphilus serpentinus]